MKRFLVTIVICSLILLAESQDEEEPYSQDEPDSQPEEEPDSQTEEKSKPSAIVKIIKNCSDFYEDRWRE